MAIGSGSLLDDIKNQIKRSGANKGKFVYFKPGVKNRVRFIQDMDEGMKVLFHDSYSLGINVPCQELFGRDCDKCDNEELRHQELYLWCVWDYEAKEVKILMGRVNNFSPIPLLVGMYEAYGTLTDRDYVITKNGSQTNTTFSVVPMDKVKFKNKEAKSYSESKILKLLDKAFPDSDTDDKEDKGNKKNVDVDYEDMSSKQLYKLCKERDIECKADKKESYYIKLLEESEEESEEDTVDYEEMTAKELYELCNEHDIECKPRKDAEYYIKKLEEADKEKEEDEW